MSRSVCLVCDREGYQSDLAWHIRQEHIVPFLERPEDATPPARGVVSIIREMSRGLVATNTLADLNSLKQSGQTYDAAADVKATDKNSADAQMFPGDITTTQSADKSEQINLAPDEYDGSKATDTTDATLARNAGNQSYGPTDPDSADPLKVQEDDMCPNCVTPWKCNGPHTSWPRQTGNPYAHEQPNGSVCISSIREDDGSCEFCGSRYPDRTSAK